MLRPFRLKGPIGLEYNMDLDDAFNTKKAFRDLGHFRVPKFGLTPYPDEPMIDGIKSFQRRNGLREDGVMKPDGPTIKRLNDTLVERQRPKPPPGPFSTVPLPRPIPMPRRRSLLDTVLGIPQPLVRATLQSNMATSVMGVGQAYGRRHQTASLFLA